MSLDELAGERRLKQVVRECRAMTKKRSSEIQGQFLGEGGGGGWGAHSGLRRHCW